MPLDLSIEEFRTEAASLREAATRMIVVSDTSPLNDLILVRLHRRAATTVGEVYAPSSVVIELGHPRSPEPVRTWAASPPEWLNLKEPAAIDSTLNLDPDETAAIALAEELKADRLLIDERDGRDVAKQRGLSVVGTLNVLNEAAELDLIDLPKVIEQLRPPVSTSAKSSSKTSSSLTKSESLLGNKDGTAGETSNPDAIGWLTIGIGTLKRPV